MSSGLNRAILVGNLGLAPELKHTATGHALLRCRLATSRSFRDAEGNVQERTEWHTVIVWGKRATALQRILGKGERLGVEGEIRYRSWQGEDGRRREAAEIHASEVVLLGGPRRAGAATEAAPAVPDDDIPF